MRNEISALRQEVHLSQTVYFRVQQTISRSGSGLEGGEPGQSVFADARRAYIPDYTLASHVRTKPIVYGHISKTKFEKVRSKAVSNKSHKKLIQKCIALSFFSLSLAGCATPTPTLDTGPNAEITFDGLHAVQNSAAAKAWAIPSLDLSRYNKIMFEGAGIEFRPGGESGRTSLARSSSGPYEVTDEQKARFRQVVGETLLEELGKSERFTLVNEAGPDVLLIRAALLDVVSYVPPEPIGRTDVYLAEIGAVTLVLELHDSITDAILVRAIDRSSIGDDMMMRNSNRVTNTAEVRRVIRKWASTLRERLDSFSGFENTAE